MGRKEKTYGPAKISPGLLLLQSRPLLWYTEFSARGPNTTSFFMPIRSLPPRQDVSSDTGRRQGTIDATQYFSSCCFG